MTARSCSRRPGSWHASMAASTPSGSQAEGSKLAWPFAGLAAFDLYTFGFATSPTVQPQMRMGFQISDNFFQVLGIRPALGRAFLPEEGKVPGRDAIALLSYDLWMNQFGGDRSVIGRTIRLNGIDFAVIGIMPESFTGMDPFIRPALYVPLTMSQRLSAAVKDPMEDRSFASLQVRGRLKPGVLREQAQAELIAIAKGLEKAARAIRQC